MLETDVLTDVDIVVDDWRNASLDPEVCMRRIATIMDNYTEVTNNS